MKKTLVFLVLVLLLWPGVVTAYINGTGLITDNDTQNTSSDDHVCAFVLLGVLLVNGGLVVVSCIGRPGARKL